MFCTKLDDLEQKFLTTSFKYYSRKFTKKTKLIYVIYEACLYCFEL